MKNNKGFTLIELIIVIALISVVLAGAFSMLNFGTTVQRMSMDEYEVQTSTRLTAARINDITRYASATFTIPESSFTEDNLTNSWNYVGIMDDEVVLYEYKEEGGTWDHHKTVIAEENDKVDYKIVFKKVEEDYEEKILGFSIIGFIKDKPIEYDEYGNPIGHITIVSQTESLNSLQIVHKGDGTEPATAIAYRTGQRDEPEIEELKPIAQIALVLDTSGSMDWTMDGRTTYREQDKRITKLKNSAKTLLDSFDATEYPHYVSLIPFSTSANNPDPFLLVEDNISTLKSNINNLDAEGGTNTGDGLRRGYYQIINNRSNTDFVDKEVSDYLIILVDGVSTFGSITGKSPLEFFTSDGNIDERDWSRGNVEGHGSSLDETYGTPYIEEVGDMITNDGNINVYVIGFGENDSEFRDNLNHIGQSTGASENEEGNYYYLAGDEDELNIIFGDIQKEILNELWYIDGPQL
jgi:prepilin-type N-terminal cleavage/methylation domain-containing protein